MPGGRFWGMLFFVFLSFAALSTVIAVFENIIAFGMNLYGWSRKKSVAVNGLAIVLLSIPCVLGFNLWSGFQPLGPGSSILDLEDFIVSNNLLPLGSLAFVLFCTKKNGWGWKNFLGEANDGEGRNLPSSLRNYLLYVLPLLIITIYLKGYYDMFSKQGTEVLAKWLFLAALFLGFIFYTASRKKA
jgi:NSS family neurotransmitter:Na+ symporter